MHVKLFNYYTQKYYLSFAMTDQKKSKINSDFNYSNHNFPFRLFEMNQTNFHLLIGRKTVKD